MVLGRTLDRLPQPVVAALALLLLAGLGALDRLTGPEVAFAFFYLLPITLVTWHAGRRAGLASCVLAALTSLAAGLGRRPLYEHAFFFYWNIVITLGLFVVVTLMVAELRRAQERVREVSQLDALTGVPTRRAFGEMAELEKNRARRYFHPLTMVNIDLDDFKRVNCRFGHLIGDALLRLVAQVLRNSIRQTDTVARVAGDEFALLLPETGPEAAQAVVSKIHEALTETAQTGGWPLTFSIGVVTFVSAPDS
ncbi:MAG TPA: GGDEF domain-containing protein, partial [Terriglobales bacterium]|nr:GGDEF domain-containing protein [Terriglobales bacterium]